MAEGQPPDQNFTLWITIAVLAMTVLAVLVIVVFRLAMKRVMLEREKMRQAELAHQQNLLLNSINTQERERQRIAADIHDELAARLSVLKLSLYQMKTVLPELSGKTNHMLDEAIAISRNISHDLYPPLLAELGLAETLRGFLEPLESQLEVDIFINGESDNLSPEQALHLFRITQELTQNTLKYAEADKLSLMLRITDQQIALKLSDNGKGFDVKQARGGLGLSNIESRVQVLGGYYKMKSTLGKGSTTIILTAANHAKPNLSLS